MNGIIYKFFLLVLLLFTTGNSQRIEPNEYGLRVVESVETYLSLIENDSNRILINLEEYIPGIVLDIKYATKDNFVGEAVYNIPKAYIRLPAARMLKKIQNELKKENLGLKIFDAYRPYSVTVLFYKKIGDPDFVATPQKGSRHNRGCAVDLTIIDLTNGKEVVMPTDYDDFTEEASHNFSNLSEEALKNREKLKTIMTANGFDIYSAEWWHYDFRGWENFELMDISFEELTELEKLN